MNKMKINKDLFEAIKTITYVRGVLKGIIGYRDEKDQTAIMLTDCDSVLLGAVYTIKDVLDEVDIGV